MGTGLTVAGGFYGIGLYWWGINNGTGTVNLFYNVYATGGSPTGSTNGFGANTYNTLQYGAFGFNFNIPYYAQPLVFQIVTKGSSTPGSYTLANLMSSTIVYSWGES